MFIISRLTEPSKKSLFSPLSLFVNRQLCLALPAVIAALVICAFPARAQTTEAGSLTASPLILQAVTSETMPLIGHVSQRLLADAQDQGTVDDSTPLRLYIVLQRTPAQKADLTNLIARQQQPTAAEYHQWLTPREFGQRFGAAQQDIAKITSWLQAQGIQVNAVMNSASFIDVSTTAGQIRQVFGTQLHNLSLNGRVFPAATQEPNIPAALAPAIAAIQGLTRVPPRMHIVNPHPVSYDSDTRTWQSLLSPDSSLPNFSDGYGDYLLAPQDLYAIYNIKNVMNATGLNNLAANSTVAVIEQSDIEFGSVDPTTGAATGGDVATFRSVFGVPGTLNMHVYHGYGSVTCSAPGIDPNGIGEDTEASLDAEWASATAPSANLIFMSCDQTADNGIFGSFMAVIDNNLADVMSLSYGSSELYQSSGNYSFYDGLWSQAAAQGETIFISSGDSGSDVRDQNTNVTATSGINVSAFSASPLVTATGGTDFSDLFDSLRGGPAQSTYWGANSSFYGDALSYVPETSWNGNCAGSLRTAYQGLMGTGFCSAYGYNSDGQVVAGSGGFSTNYQVPSYQTGILGYSGSQRAQPDIAGFASVGPWGHALLYCDSHYSNTTCATSSAFGAAGGTSFVAPYMAGVGGLLASYTGSRQGVLNPALYALAKTQFTASSTSTSCYANGQTANTGVTVGLPASQCTFNDITTGNNDVPCQIGSLSCYVAPGTSFGMLSLTGSSSLTVAFPSTPGYDETTGLGSLNVYNLLTNWNKAFTSSVVLAVPNPTTISAGQSTALSASVTGGAPAGYIDTPPAITGTIKFAGNSGSLGTCSLSAGSCGIIVPGSALQAGANSVTATFQGDPTYPSATSTPQTVTLGGSTQTITFTTNAPASALYGSTFTVAATATSGLAVTFTSSGACSNVAGVYTMTSGNGTCSVIANQAGNASFGAAPTVTQTVNAAKASQTITFSTNAPATAANGTTFTVAATASSSLPVTFTSSGTCTNAGTTYTMTSGTGVCSVIANQAGNGNYSAAPTVTQTVNATNSSQTITFTTNAPGTAVYGSNFTVAATATSGLAVTFTSSGACSNVAGVYTMTSGNGTCSVIANQAGNSSFGAAPTVTQTTTATPASQTITFSANAPATAANGTTFTVAATASSSLPVAFTSNGACTNVGTTYTMTSGTGVCSVIANQAGTVNYSAAPQVTQTVNATNGSQTITFTTNAPATAAYNSTFTVAATATSGLPVAFTSGGVCSNVGALYTMTSGTGTCSVIANQAGNASFGAAPTVTQTVNAAKASQTIIFSTNAPASASYNSTFTVAASASSSLPVTFTSSGACTNVSGVYTVTSAYGTCSVIANQAGNANFGAATPVTQIVNATQASQTITFTTNAPSTAADGASFTVAASASSSLPVTFTSSGACSNVGALFIMASGTGVCSVIANQAGNANYSAAPQVTQMVNATNGSQTITFTTNAPASAVYNSTFTVAATATSGLPVSFTSGGACSNVGGVYTITSGNGTCSVIANQAGNASFGAAPTVTQTVSATRASQTITFSSNAPASAVYNGTFTVAASASSSLAVTFTSSGACSNAAAVYTMTSGTGACSVIANQAGNNNYTAAPQVTQTTTATPATQTITFTSNAPSTAANGTTFTVAGTASSSLPVTFTSSGVCTNVGTTYTMTSGTGVCSVIANQAGNANYSAAPQVTQTVNATNGSQTITFTTNAPASAVYNSTFTVAATATSGLPVSFSSSGACSNVGGVYTITNGNGTCSVIANQAGNASFGAAPTVTQTVSATRASQTITFSTPATQVVGTPLALTASASSGLAISYDSSTTTSVCTVSNGASPTALFLTPGSCKITASQPGGTNYTAASPVSVTFAVITSGGGSGGPVITGIQAVTIGETSEIISWTTDQPSSSLVNYGLTSSYGSSSTPNATLVTNHSVTVTGLAAQTTYNFDVVSANSTAVTSTSTNSTFKTIPSVGYVAFWGVNNSGVTISWSTDEPANTFVAYGTTTALGQVSLLQTALTTGHGVVLTGLNAGTTYYFMAESTDANGNTGGSTTYSFTTTGVPTAPAPVISNVASGSIGMTAATISWTTDQLSTSQVNYGTTTAYGSSSPVASTPVTNHSVTLTNLTPGTTYNFDVLSANTSGTSVGTSSNYTFTTLSSAAPPVISNVSAGTPGSNSVTITWTTDQPSWSQVHYGTSTAYGSSSPLNNSLVTSHAVTIGGLNPNTTYDFDVMSVNAGALSSTSPNSSFTTASVSTAPAPYVSYVAYWGINNSGITISWSTDLLSNTEIAYGTSSTSLPAPIVESATLANSHGVVLTGLNSGTTYYFQAVSKTAAGGVGTSIIYSFTTTGAPSSAPNISGLTATSIANTSAVIIWNTDQPSSSQVNYGTTASYGTLTTLSTALVTSHSVTMLNLSPGTTYHLQVTSTNSNSQSSTSAPDYSFTTTGAKVQEPVISNVAATSVTSGTAIITWTTDQVSSSQVNYGTSTTYGNSTTPDPTAVTSHSVTLSGLTASTTYNFDVVSGATTSSNSTFTTNPGGAAPPVISNVASWSITQTGLTVSWSTNVPATTAINYGTTASLGTISPVETSLTVSHGIVLTGLTPGTVYYFQPESADANGDTGYSATTYSFTTLSGPPIISNISFSPATGNTATISWTTNEAAYSYVKYGQASNNYLRYSAGTSLTTTPVCTLTYVPSGTVYYRVVSTDANGNETASPEMTFLEP